MKAKLIIILCFIAPFLGSAQSNFSVSPDTVVAEKPATFFVFYNYADFENNIDDTLFMRWVKLEEIRTDLSGNPGPFQIWEIGIQDPGNSFLPAIGIDSADFFLPPVTGSIDKFIYQLLPNNTPGRLYAKFKFYPIAAPSDTAIVVFDYTAQAPVTSNQSIPAEAASLRLSPNPASEICLLDNRSDSFSEVDLLHAQGDRIGHFRLSAGEKRRIDLSGLPSGLYWVISRQQNEVRTQKLIKL
jgi:hypothetical protein